MPLADIARSLDGDADDLGSAVTGQLEEVERQLELVRELRARLAA